MHTRLRHGQRSLADLTRAGAILLGAVLMGVVALVVGPTQVSWSGTRLAFILLMGVSALLTIRFMPVRLPGGGPRSHEDETAPDRAHTPRTAVVAAATLAGGAAAPLLAGVGAFFFLLAIFAGWLFGLSVKVILKSGGR